jgi:type IV secretory pathway VirJ component
MLFIQLLSLRGKCDQPMNSRNSIPYLALSVAMMLGAGSSFAAPKPATPGKSAHPAAPALPGLPANAVRLNHGRFQDLIVYSPAATPSSFVLFLSGDSGWDADDEGMAQRLVQRGAMVTGIDLPKFKANLDADGAQCVFPDGDLENLSHFVQAYTHGAAYLPPMLVGVNSGAGLAYGMLAQAPKDTFASALTMGFCPTFDWHKSLCKGSGVEFEHAPSGVKFKPIPKLGNPWVNLQSTSDNSCPAAEAAQFVSRIDGAAGVTLGWPQGWPKGAPFDAAFAKLAAFDAASRATPAPNALVDLPVVEVPAKPGAAPGDSFAILMSGDGGWAGLDQDIAGALSAAGIPVVGLDSLRYYWTSRTPEGLAADTDRMIRYYLAHFGKQRVLLVGYSQGADVLPFAVNRLPAATRQSVALAAILGMSEHAVFEFHLANWVSDDNSGPATLPEVNRITDIPVLCIYGEDESDSLCPKLDPKKFLVVKVKGNHHFDGNYTGLAQEIMRAAKSGPQPPSSRSNP